MSAVLQPLAGGPPGALSVKTLLRRVLPPAFYTARDRMRHGRVRLLQKLLCAAGLNPVRLEDYYSPLPSVEALRATRQRWDRPSSLLGVAYDLPAMRERFSALLAAYGPEAGLLPPHAELARRGFGPGYPEQDALLLYMTLRNLKPKRYLEVGSGLSTCYSRLAAEQNARDGAPLRIQCIEPFPGNALRSIPDIELSVREVQDEPISTFAGLEAGDVLFIDCSHALKIDSDVAYLYLEALPALAPGVHIHIHDIPFPYNHPYPSGFWVFGQTWPMLWNEAMLLQAFLAFNSRFHIRISLPLLRHFDESFLRGRLPHYRSVDDQPNTFSSIWLQTT